MKRSHEILRTILKPSLLHNLTRRYTPPARALALYQQDYHMDYKFPVDLIDSSEVRYAQYLYRLQDESSSTAVAPTSGKKVFPSKHCYTQDFEKLKKMDLPIFWERELDVTQNKEFAKTFHENFVFLMKWMQSNGDLGRIAEVKQYFELLLNEKTKKIKITIYTPSISHERSTSSHKWLIGKAKSLINGEATLHEKKAYDMEFSFSTDQTLRHFSKDDGVKSQKQADGSDMENAQFYIEVAGLRIVHEPALSQSDAAAKLQMESNVDYSKIKTKKSVIKTTWDDGVETSILGNYFDQLAKMDEEEQLHGV